MDLKKLRELLKLVAESDISEVEIEEDDMKVTIRKDSPFVAVQSPAYYPPMPQYAVPPAAPGAAGGPQPATAPATPPAAAPVAPPVAGAEGAGQPASGDQAASAKEYLVRAPIVGTYYQSPSPDSDPFVSVGSDVVEGSVLCIIEAMKLMNEIECEVSGTIKEVLVQNGEPVEYDQPLFVIETA